MGRICGCGRRKFSVKLGHGGREHGGEERKKKRRGEREVPGSYGGRNREERGKKKRD